MDPPSIGLYRTQPSSKKRVFLGGSSLDTVEISPPPVDWSSKSKWLKQKEVIDLEAIDLDVKKDFADVMVVDQNVDIYNKGKGAWSNFPFKVSDIENGKSFVTGLHKSSDSGSFNEDFPYHDDEYMDEYHDALTYDRDYALQAHFDSKGIPPGDEVPVPWFLFPTHAKKPPPTVNSSYYSSSSRVSDLQTDLKKLNPPCNLDLTLSSRALESDVHTCNLAVSASSTNSNSQAEIGALSYQHATRPQVPLPFYIPPVHGSTADYTSQAQAGAVRPSSGFHPSSLRPYAHSSSLNFAGNSGLTNPPVPPMFPMPCPTSSVGTYMHWWKDDSFVLNQSSFESDDNFISAFSAPFPFEKDFSFHFVQDPADSQKNATAARSSSVPFETMPDMKKIVDERDILEKFQKFKQFDTVQGFSDHRYQSCISAKMEPSKNWSKRIQEEWRILEKDLPDTILVRVDESRMDFLRAVIVGAEGTPYHDGLFFFDITFPNSYPSVPPHLFYHSGGLEINPNLYSCGKVCLSLLNTWTGDHQNEMWIPGVSTILQVLVSIQALILNEKPYFNEPGYECTRGSPHGEMSSQRYSENVFIFSLKTMVYALRKPPKHFEDFVFGHYFKRAQDILGACKAYVEGAALGSFVKGGAQKIDAGNNNSSQYFRHTLAGYIPVLVQTFSAIGVKDLEKFLPLASKDNSQASSVPMAFNCH